MRTKDKRIRFLLLALCLAALFASVSALAADPYQWPVPDSKRVTQLYKGSSHTGIDYFENVDGICRIQVYFVTPEPEPSRHPSRNPNPSPNLSRSPFLNLNPGLSPKLNRYRLCCRISVMPAPMRATGMCPRPRGTMKTCAASRG